VPTPASDPTGRPQPLQGPENVMAWKVLEQLDIPMLTVL
jgi:hypothetical protein